MSTGVYSPGYPCGMAQLYLDYARADDHLPDGDPLGHVEMAQLTGRSLPAVYKWFERGRLPLADGPLVRGLPTWRRRTFLAWAYNNFATRDRQPNGDPGPKLPIHEEAQRWAAEVDEDSIRPLCEMAGWEQRRSAAG
jgi:hypothetical protein